MVNRSERALDWANIYINARKEEINLSNLTIDQIYENYTDEQTLVWNTMYKKRMLQLENEGSSVFLNGIKTIKLDEKIPNLTDVNSFLEPVTGWTSVPVPGYIPSICFFLFLSQKQFPTTVSLRTMKNLDYIPEPDIIHDVFGHVPMHTNPDFSDFLQKFGEIALQDDHPFHMERMARLFWYTVEFGLIREDNKIKLYGSGLISSQGEGYYALHSDRVKRRNFDVKEILDTPFEIDKYQNTLYVLDSFEQLKESISLI